MKSGTSLGCVFLFKIISEIELIPLFQNVDGVIGTILTLRLKVRFGIPMKTSVIKTYARKAQLASISSCGPYDIFVRELVAMDGIDNSEILLIDALGCPTDTLIMGALSKARSEAKVLQATFDAFKFPTSEIVQFKALVTPCLPACEPKRNGRSPHYNALPY
ncbi:uncharacterized protein NPIL_480471 [Nephila pilipes]|uniref:Uncharacterized protein n=1 Tax=Nephila pilipes TaxID=299642 RepID=A0A8X6PT02_NEPPI|nr:uncharacterized protein NPIL_480471 [Nephila pilipes]